MTKPNRCIFTTTTLRTERNHTFPETNEDKAAPSVVVRTSPKNPSKVGYINGLPQKDSTLKQMKSLEQKAFEELPKGWKPCEVMSKLHPNDVIIVHRHAYGQAERFEILKMEDVRVLSQELRYLDERADRLRHISKILRAARHNFHSDLCQYLRISHVTRFTNEWMIKKMQYLTDLDSSINDWIIKLERVENRRIRIRQKLLEHVAAATIVSVPGNSTGTAN